MSNIKFGNYITELRNEKGYTQRYIASELGVSDKAVSKWENGKSNLSIEQLSKLASLYDVDVNDLLKQLVDKEKEPEITKIVLTGGPCGGKSTALTWIDNYFSKRGYRVLSVPETATELIVNGTTPTTCRTNFDFQRTLFRLQKFKEQLIEENAKNMKVDKVLIVCDRGILDNKAYMTDLEFKKVLSEFHTNEVTERDSYDAVFQLVTAAKGKEECFTLENNKARKDTLAGAIELDDKIIASWTGHPHFRIIDNSTDFEEKLERLLKEIALFLGEPEPLEIERKFIIDIPSIRELEKMPNCTKVDITQTYLKSDGLAERRVRARGIDGNYIYYLTEKKTINSLKRVEVERKLEPNEYIRLLMEADSSLRPIRKTRYCLTENNQYFEIDIYPEWNKQAIMEIELSNEDEVVKTPEYINIIKEVTTDECYKNSNMAKKMPEQLKD